MTVLAPSPIVRLFREIYQLWLTVNLHQHDMTLGIYILRHTSNYAKWIMGWREKNSGIKSCMRLSASQKLSPIGCPEDLSQEHKSVS